MKDKEGEIFRDHLATVNEQGKRIWIFPKKPSGRFYTKRKWLSYFLLSFLFLAPHIRINGHQMILLNVIDRKFMFFGKVFWPQDLYLFALALIVGVIFVILFTIIYGRLFCGWVCPQTIFMEMLFRRIEYWIDGDWTHQKKLKNQSWNKEKILKRLAKHTLFWILSFLIANTFLAYIIGSDALWEIQTDPVGVHLTGFIAIAVFTTTFYLVYTRLREQVCTTICPYGRLQGVLLDKNSMVVAYDYQRGEERAKFKKNEDRQGQGKGDCIDCHQCVHVCPTGIDIRNGTQLECINCTACIDACDHMMEGVGLEKGLIRIVSEIGIQKRQGFRWTKRVKSYTMLLFLMISVLITLLITRKDFDATVIRQRGTTFQMANDGMVSNIFEINLLNKTNNDYKIELKLQDKVGIIIPVVERMQLKEEATLKERFRVELPLSSFDNGKKILTLVILGNGQIIQKKKIKVIGPLL